MLENESVELLKNQKGIDKCPPDKLALYTNVDYNNSEIGDILLISPDIQLDQEELESYGFDVGQHDGVSCVVNNMNQAASLVAGLNLDGDILNVPAMSSIPSLVPQGWNDLTRSVVSAPVALVTLEISSESPLNVILGQENNIELNIENKSSVTIPGVTLEVTVKNNDLITVVSYPEIIDLPGSEITTIPVSLKGNKTGETTLSVRIYTPIGFINQGSNTYDVNAEVKGVITLKLTLDKQIVLLTGETKSVPLKIANQSSVTINGLIVGATSGNDAIMTVGEFNSPVDIYQNDSVVIDIPLNANSSATGTTNLVCSLTPPAGYENEGDNNITSTVTVTAERELEVLQEFQASWAGEGGYLYSYMLTLKSQNTRVNKWELSFQLPSGAVVSENWYESQKNWLTKVEVDGNVILSNTTGHTIDPGVDLPLQIQLVYPDQSEYYKYIYSLSLRQIQ
ncbi:hypothetical protein [Providencia sp. Je.9.19]|uniref:hypothetical protein n=1 Tax=unclassified Providencia TaxID=2633465 RepID=UPI003DAA1AD8